MSKPRSLRPEETWQQKLFAVLTKTFPVNYETYIRSSRWKKKADAAKARAGWRCQGCNRHRGQVTLEAHHRTYERLGFELPGDITVFCPACHEAITQVIADMRAGRPRVRMHGLPREFPA